MPKIVLWDFLQQAVETTTTSQDERTNKNSRFGIFCIFFKSQSKMTDDLDRSLPLEENSQNNFNIF